MSVKEKKVLINLLINNNMCILYKFKKNLYKLKLKIASRPSLKNLKIISKLFVSLKIKFYASVRTEN